MSERPRTRDILGTAAVVGLLVAVACFPFVLMILPLVVPVGMCWLALLVIGHERTNRWIGRVEWALPVRGRWARYLIGTSLLLLAPVFFLGKLYVLGAVIGQGWD